MTKFLQILLTPLIGLLTGLISFTAGFALYMYCYIALFGSFLIQTLFGTNNLENPVFWASILGAVIGIVIGFFIGLVLSILDFIFDSKDKAAVLISSSLIPFAIIYGFYEFMYVWSGDGLMAVPESDSYEIIKLSLISLLPALITGLVASSFNDYLKPNSNQISL